MGVRCENHGEAFREISDELEKAENTGYFYDNAEDYEENRQILTALAVLSYGFIILISLIAVANVFNTVSTNLMLRRKEFAMLRSVGMDRKGFRRMMCYECLIYGLRSILYGLILFSSGEYADLASAGRRRGYELYRTLGINTDQCTQRIYRGRCYDGIYNGAYQKRKYYR